MTIVLIIGHFSTSAKFRGNIKIPRLGSKFCDPQKTVGPTDKQQHKTNIMNLVTINHRDIQWIANSNTRHLEKDNKLDNAGHVHI